MSEIALTNPAATDPPVVEVHLEQPEAALVEALDLLLVRQSAGLQKRHAAASCREKYSCQSAGLGNDVTVAIGVFRNPQRIMSWEVRGVPS